MRGVLSDKESGTATRKAKPGFFRRLFIGETPETPVESPSPEPVSVQPITLLVDATPDPVVTAALVALDAERSGVPTPVTSFEPSAAESNAAETFEVLHVASVEAPAAELTAPEPNEAIAAVTVASPAPADPPPAAETAEPHAKTAKVSWWSRLRDGLSRSSSSIGTGISDIFTKRKLDAAMLEDLEDVLIRSDLGVATATRISQAVGKGRYDRDVSPDDVKAILADEVERVLTPYALPIEIGARKPFVILVVGVNGSGKTTTIGKLAAKFTGEGRNVLLAAGDTFRAAAIAQLTIWGERFGCAVVAREQGSDAAGLAFEAIEQARATGADVLLMDTAGRLQNRAELMAELEKIIRVMRKIDVEAPHAVLLVLDATVGQNAMSQVEIFGKVAGVTGLVMTKLDGTARGGILVAITEKFKLPVHFIGVGETADDLEPFAARDFAEAIAGIARD